MKKAWNSQEIKGVNRKVVLEVLHFNSPISRAEIADITGLTRATVTNIIKEFEALGLVEEVGKKSGSYGRRKSLLKFKSGAFLVMGVVITEEEMQVGIFDIEANEMGYSSIEIDENDSMDHIIEALLKIMNDIVKTSNVDKDRIFGIGVGVSRFVNAKKNISILRLKSVLEKRFKIPVWIDNIANAAALGEKWYGVGKDYDNFVFVMADRSLQASMIIDGEIYRGPFKIAGGVGYNPSSLNESCPNIESKTSVVLLKKAYESETGKSLSINEVLDLAQKEDSIAMKILRELNGNLSHAVVSLVNILCPEAVII
ncbi:MAG: ROK family protein, partial [Thermotogaceae bacterium]|nr:ROK family protein [Thermotogaceae bacterium]